MGGAEAPLISPPCLAGQQGWRDLRGAQSPVQHGDPPGQKTAPHTCQDCQIFLKNIPAIYGMWLVTLLLLYSLQEGKRGKKECSKYFKSCAQGVLGVFKLNEKWKWMESLIELRCVEWCVWLVLWCRKPCAWGIDLKWFFKSKCLNCWCWTTFWESKMREVICFTWLFWCFYVAASGGADSTDCFRITNSSYEYVKWLNRENEVRIQREGERQMKTCIGLQL